jgi:hypothetical protein
MYTQIVVLPDTSKYLMETQLINMNLKGELSIEMILHQQKCKNSL